MLASFCRKVMWLVLVVTMMFQGIAIYSIANGNAAQTYDYRPLLVATVLMILSVFCFRILPRGKIVPFIVAIVTGVFFVVLAIQMLQVFGMYELVDGSRRGLNLWRTIYRHMSPVLIPLCMVPVWLEYRRDRKDEKKAKEETPPDSYFELLDESFKMASLEDDTHRPKRSVQKRNEKAEE
ncbi:MAG: hypothetical protein J6Q42_02190 [Clostridia bacterium]|nr:hypothetical protein [Clostridia bacterium]